MQTGGIVPTQINTLLLLLRRGLGRRSQRAEHRAVAYGLLWKGWQLFAAPISFFLILRYFDAGTQGYYYTFLSLLAAQSFFELGFAIVILNVAAHEWAGLSIGSNGEISGDASASERLASLGRLVFRWYGVGSVLFAAAMVVGGLYFFADSAGTGANWRLPWVTAVILTAVTFWLMPFSALLEGCNHVDEVHRVSFLQAVFGNLAGWTAIALGAKLWAVAVIAAVQCIGGLYLVAIRFGPFFRSLFSRPVGARISWREEIWPMQWRLALSGLVGYFAFSLFNPVMFRYHGPKVAGQMGMSIQVINAIQAAAFMWIKAKTPSLGQLIAKREFRLLDRTWARGMVLTAGTYVVLGIGFLGACAVLKDWDSRIGERILPVPYLVVFLVAGLLFTIALGFTAYLRAHKREPLLVMSVTTCILTGLLVWQLGRVFGAAGSAWGYLLSVVVILVWDVMIWRRCRVEWHHPTAAPAPTAAVLEAPVSETVTP